jgi:ABC-type polysaccharide/polyol phosphate export permease
LTTTLYSPSLGDIRSTIGAYRVWHLLALQDIRQRYRRSVLGPFWITLSTMISIAALGLVYTRIFKMPTEQYLPFLTLGIVMWTLISSLVVEACSVFIAAESIIKQVNLPFGVHVARMVWRNVIIFFHNLFVAAIVLIFMSSPVSWHLLLLPLALAITAVAGVTLGYLLGALCTRFRDVPLIVNSLMQVLFYVTPVIWTPAMLKGHESLLYFNPAYHYLEILRAPLLGTSGPISSWIVAAGTTIALGLIAHLFLSRFRHRIAYWL